jgi:hypothetical protein
LSTASMDHFGFMVPDLLFHFLATRLRSGRSSFQFTTPKNRYSLTPSCLRRDAGLKLCRNKSSMTKAIGCCFVSLALSAGRMALNTGTSQIVAGKHSRQSRHSVLHSIG